MLSENLLVYSCGIYSLLFALFHTAFWQLFRWKKALQNLDPVNRAIFQILNLRLIYVFLLAGFLCFAYPAELRQTSLGSGILMGFAIFWLGRLIEQFIFLRINNWRIHLLTGIFTIGIILFSWAAWQ